MILADTKKVIWPNPTRPNKVRERCVTPGDAAGDTLGGEVMLPMEVRICEDRLMPRSWPRGVTGEPGAPAQLSPEG